MKLDMRFGWLMLRIFALIVTLKLILHSLYNSCSWYNHYLHVYWDYDKNILAFEEEYGDKYEN